MNFFKSILSDDPEPPNSESDPVSPGGVSNPTAGDDDWSFSGFIKTFSAQSESVIETYRKDLQEFGSGLRKETEMLRETASRAVKDLPASLEAAQGAIDVVLKSTASMINKEALGFSSDGPDTPGTNRSLNSGRYSRFEAQLSAIQSDSNTFCVEPEDAEDYGKWKLGFELGDYVDEIEFLIGENGILEGVYRKAVPSAVDEKSFWCRYFYRVEKLKQQESMRASLVKRAISNDEEEELSWDVDDDDDGSGSGSDRGGDEKSNGEFVDGVKGNVVELSEKSSVDEREEVKCEESVEDGSGSDRGGDEKSNGEAVDGVKGNVVELSEKSSVDEREEVKCEESVEDGNDEKVAAEEKGECKASVVMSDHLAKVVAEEEEVGWDEIGDVGSGDEKKTSATGGGGSPNKSDLRKRLTVEDDDEDLNWDIEDDDEPVKA